MIAALAATLAHPRWWALALAAFLVRGGIVVLALPILVLPSVPDLAGAFGTTAARLVLGEPAILLTLGLGALLGAVGIVLVLGALGASLEQALIEEALADEDIEDELRWTGEDDDAEGAPTPLGLARATEPAAGPLPALSARLLAHAPTAIALGWAGVRIASVVADQLLSPSEPGVTVIGRVLRDAPEALLAPVVVWAVAELVAGVAVRRLDASGAGGVRSVVAAVARAAATVVRHPSVVGAWLLGTLALLAAVAPTWLAVAVSFDRVRSAIAGVPAAGPLGPALLALVASWIAGLGLVAIAAAWRSVGMTVVLAGGRRER